MPNKYNKLSKNTFLFIVNSFGTKIISFVLVPLYTYTLSTQDFGTVDLIYSTIQLLIPILTLNIQDAVLRYALDETQDKKEVISVGIKINFYGVILLLILIIFSIKFRLLEIDNMYICYILISYIVGGFYNIFSMYLKATDNVKILVISGVLNTFIACLLNIILLLKLKLGVSGYLIANVAGMLIAITFMFYFGDIYKDFKIRTNKKLTIGMLSYSAPLVLNTVAWWINNASDKYIITMFCGFAVNGIYSIAYKIPTILSTLQSIFYSSWSISAITDFDENDSDGFILNIYLLYSCVSIVGCSIIMVCNKLLAELLYANEFYIAWQSVPFLLLGTTFNGIALFEGCLFTAVRNTKEVSRITVIGAIVNTVLNFLLIPFLGAVGASVATMLGYFTIWIIRTIRLQKIIVLRVNWKQQAILMTLLLLQTCLALFNDTEIVQLIILFLIIFVQRKYIKKIIFKTFKLVKGKF
ncbi:lipopolysaccharide biosynthesis protein [Clostridium paraputrificum]|uniref:lipopolysaccharide biosynthesis protein n=1 Tax=Clostridium paraputrificum TaxID=29363 RepID=UPI0011CB1C98|nr:oligosaccharide flippase family protein [Clostridium paraputrificum]